MDPVVKVAAQMGPEWLYVVSSILVVVVGVLGVVTWWLLKKRATETSKRIDSLETEHKLFLGSMGVITERLESRNRADDVLEKRLSSGAESFKNNQQEHEKIMESFNEKLEHVNDQIKSTTVSISNVQNFFVKFASEYTRTEQFNRHCDEDKESRKELKNEMNNLTDRMEGYSRETLGVLKVMEGRLSAMSEILTRREPPVGKSDD